MKLAEGMKIITDHWVVKPKQFRVRFQKLVDSKLVTDYSPELEKAGLDSDVTTWRYAWKLYQSTKSDSDEIQENELVNVTVVDESDNPVNYYVTNKTEVFNTK